MDSEQPNTRQTIKTPKTHLQSPATNVHVPGGLPLGKQATKHTAVSCTPKARVVELQLYQDHLGKLVSKLSNHLCDAVSWEEFVNQVRGPSYLADDIQDIPHQACTYLQALRDNGAEVNMDDPPWAAECITSCAKRGPHPSANLHCDFLCVRSMQTSLKPASGWCSPWTKSKL